MRKRTTDEEVAFQRALDAIRLLCDISSEPEDDLQELVNEIEQTLDDYADWDE